MRSASDGELGRASPPALTRMGRDCPPRLLCRARLWRERERLVARLRRDAGRCKPGAYLAVSIG